MLESPGYFYGGACLLLVQEYCARAGLLLATFRFSEPCIPRGFTLFGGSKFPIFSDPSPSPLPFPGLRISCVDLVFTVPCKQHSGKSQ